MKPNYLLVCKIFAGYTFFFTLFLFVTFRSQGVFTDDGFFHYRVASLMYSHEKPWVNITALPYTVLGESGPDHHWLWHVILVPITMIFNNDFLGLKVAIALMGAIVPVSLFVFLNYFNVRYPWLVATLGIFAINDLPGRYLLLCAQNIALLFVLLYIICAVKKSYLTCGIISFLFMLSYHGAILLVPVSIIIFLVFIAYGERNINILIFTCAGLLAGLIINPWFPKTIDYVLFHVFHKMLTHTNMAVGQEWNRISFIDSFRSAWISHICLFGSLLFLAISGEKRRIQEIVSLETVIMVCLAVLSLLLYLFASRFSEYYGPIAVLAAALVIRDSQPVFSDKKGYIYPASMIVLVLLIVPKTVDELSKGGRIDGSKYFEVNAYLSQHAKDGEVVFNLRWDDFVFLFWSNPQLHYVNGLDPNFLASGSPEKYRIWSIYALAQLPDVPDQAEYIKKNFSARWITMDFLYTPLIDKLLEEKNAKLVAGNQRTLLFELPQ